ncbi:thiazole tautomerase TenI [Bacillus dakarensis]|uniref:thiazole tautomerase TenI n=1 Tax=Robertmurraya dakarensis TaxID=1926278 RepID=UPI00301DBBFB
MKLRKHELHIISTGTQTIETFAEIAVSIQEYVDYFHLREKQMSALQLYQAVNLLKTKGIPLSKIIINDRVDVAWAANTYGVQLPHHSLDGAVVKKAFPGLRVGCSVHSYHEAKEAEQKRANFAMYGHIFQTNSKPGTGPRGLGELKEITRDIELPIIAIGGIKPSNCAEVLRAGAKGIAVMSGILLADDPLKEVKAYSGVLERGK